MSAPYLAPPSQVVDLTPIAVVSAAVAPIERATVAEASQVLSVAPRSAQPQLSPAQLPLAAEPLGFVPPQPQPESLPPVVTFSTQRITAGEVAERQGMAESNAENSQHKVEEEGLIEPAEMLAAETATGEEAELAEPADSDSSDLDIDSSQVAEPEHSGAGENWGQLEEPDALDLYQQIFGTERDRIYHVIAPLIINDQRQEDLQVQVAGNQIKVQAGPTLNALRLIARDDVVEQVAQQVDADSNLNLADLIPLGLNATFDQQTVEVRVQVPPALLATRVHQRQPSARPIDPASLRLPSRLSAYVNLRSGVTIHQGERQPVRLNLDGAVNLDGWVLEGSGTLIESGNPGWTRGDLRLVRDQPDQALRYTVGDLTLPTTGYQSSLPLAGAMVARNYSLQPQRVVRPVRQFEFFLERPATVEILINGRLSQTLSLPAGPQDVRDLPLSGGVNDVQLVITDDLGRVQQLSFPSAIASELLAPGTDQFAAAVGVPRGLPETLAGENARSGRQYRWDTPTASLSYRLGLSNTLTLGSYLQAQTDHQLLGLEGVLATPLGNWGWDIATSHQVDHGFGYGVQLRYDLLQSSARRNLRVGLEHQSPGFMPLGHTSLGTGIPLDLTATYSQPLGDSLNLSLNGSYRLGAGENPHSYGLGLGLNYSLGSGLQAGLGYSYRYSPQSSGLDPVNQRLNLRMSWSIPRSRQSISATTELTAQGSPNTRLNWNFNSGTLLHRLSGGTTVGLGQGDFSGAGRLNYIGPRLTAQLAQTALHRADQGWTTTSTMTFGTAIAFADGHVAWSRPIDNSFALVVPRANLAGQRVGVNPSQNSYQAQADGLGAAVLPHLQPYRQSAVNIIAPDAPLGHDIGPSSLVLDPTYRSGTVIYVGTEATVFARGSLIDADGSPVSLTAGRVVSLSDPAWPEMTLFTNRTGRFALTGLKPGQFQIHLVGRDRPVQFEIPAMADGVYDLGILSAD
jgi:outer membrane usher protein